MQAARFRNALEKVMLGVLCTAAAGAVGTVIYVKKVKGLPLKIDLNSPGNNPEDFLSWLPSASKRPRPIEKQRERNEESKTK